MCNILRLPSSYVEMDFMLRLEKVRWAIAGILIISILSIFSYRSVNRPANPGEICASEATDKNEQKVKTALPMWESLSRHLITIQR